MSHGKAAIACLILLACVLAAYSNHFHNDFHFDDTYSIQRNPAIRDPANIPRFFADPKLFSAQPEQRSYRPVTTASLAVDYWLGSGPEPFYFHLSTFVCFEVLLVMMFLLFHRLMDRADPHPSNVWTALAATAVFGLHPAGAETVNYVIQRADLYNALGCVASLWLFVRLPRQRRFGWYVLPAVAAMLAKPPALIFPLLLIAYVRLFERATWGSAIRATAPALAAAGAVAGLLWRMRVATWTNPVASPFLYRITQPRVALHYFRMFFLPAGLNVDPGWRYVPGPFSLEAVAGYAFVLVLAGAATAAARTRPGKPVAFGFLWFAISLLPTSLMALSDVTNDHRMFFAFVGLSLAVCWSLRLALFRLTARLTANRSLSHGTLAALAVAFALAGWGVRERNRVWLTDESLWSDSIAKNPQNGRAWHNYGAAFLRQGDFATARALYERAVALDPSCSLCEADLVYLYVQVNRDDLAEQHLQRLVSLDPQIPDPYVAYGDWLHSAGRLGQSGQPLERAALRYPDSAALRTILIAYYQERDYSVHSRVFRALDGNHDLTLSSGELAAAAQALATLDQNGDGKLSPEECGVPVGLFRYDPILSALDANHDGEISAGEIRDAERELLALDADQDRRLEPSETVPYEVAAAARRVLELLDRDRDGRIDASERSKLADGPLRTLLDAADVNRDGAVTLDELANSIFIRLDLNKDGIVTPGEFRSFFQLGVLADTVPRK